MEKTSVNKTSAPILGINNSIHLPHAIVKSMRPKQWTKNIFLFAGLIFSQNFFNLPLLLETILAFIIFCLLTGSVYILNDLTDLKDDRHHPVKSRRPIASGDLKLPQAILTLMILIPASLGLSYYLNISFFIVALSYFLLQIAYSFSLKRIIILDVFVIACGFVLRVIAGALVINAEISSWLIICTILLALFLGLSKRRHELVAIGEGLSNNRKPMKEYSPYLLDQMISVVTAATVVAYALYTMSEETIERFSTKSLIYTIPFVLYGVFRYLYLIHQKGEGGNPENLLITDKPLMFNILCWVIGVMIILYV